MFPIWHEKVNDRWEVCVSMSDSGFQQVDFDMILLFEAINIVRN
jgi:hypothetical protein